MKIAPLQLLRSLSTRASIRTNIALAFIFFAITLISMLGSAAYISIEHALRTAVLADLQSTVLEKEAAIRRWFEHTLNELTSLAVL